ncbi:MAG: hypothetical protein AAGL17_14775 [Cyanobacteria bacterium J06576_12]|mgnify:CR=1 FL=1
MANTIKLTIDWRDADSDMPESLQESFTQRVWQDLRASSSVEKVERLPDPDVPEGGMGAQWLLNVLTAEIPGPALKAACEEALNHLAGKPIDITIDVGGESRKIETKNVRPDDVQRVLDQVVAAAKELKALE